MRKVNYKTLKGQNFLSIGNDTVSIDFRNGLNLITGINKDNPERANGSGKSSVGELFYYALFGTTIRNIKKEFVINNVTKGSGSIELEFDVHREDGDKSYKIIRTLKPSAVTLYENDVDITKDSIANTNSFICDLILSNSVLCKSCDILSLSDNTPFMAKKPEEKRKFIDDIFSLVIFGKMSKELKELIKKNKSDLSISTVKVSEISNTLDTLTKQYEIQKKQNDERETILNIRRDELETEIDKLNEQCDNLSFYAPVAIEKENEKLHDAWVKIDGKLATIKTNTLSKNTDIKVLENDIKSMSKIGESKCSECLQDIPHSHVENIQKSLDTKRLSLDGLRLELSELQNNEKTLIDQKSKIQTKLASNQEKLNHNKMQTLKQESLLNMVEKYEKQLVELESDISQTNSLESFLMNIGATKLRKEDEETILNSLKQTYDDLETCKFILSDDGVKSFVVKKLLGMLNASIQGYITELGMTMRCKFDEYFDEQITNDKGKQISYWNLSGGERKTIDLACAWAFKDINRKISGVTSNVEIIDEVADSAFDSAGLDKFIEGLKKRIDRDNLSCYVISHRNEIAKHVTDGEIVVMEKENGVTRRVSV